MKVRPTLEDKPEVEQLIEEGATLATIAKHYGCCEFTARERLVKWELLNNLKSKVDKEAIQIREEWIADVYPSLLTAKELGQKLNMSSSAIYATLDRLGLSPRKHRDNDALTLEEMRPVLRNECEVKPYKVAYNQYVHWVLVPLHQWEDMQRRLEELETPDG